MDPALLREREAFQKRAMCNPVVESKEKDTSDAPPKKKFEVSTPKPQKDFNYESYGESSQCNFGILAKIVKHMKQRHINGDTYPLSLEEILVETNQLDISLRQRNWLINEALANNPKLQQDSDVKYLFKPPFHVKDRRGLIRLLYKHDQRGLGGILLKDVQECIPNVEKALKISKDVGEELSTEVTNAVEEVSSAEIVGDVIQITQPFSKKKVLFYNDKTVQFNIDEDLQKLWRSVAVDSWRIRFEEYSQKQEIKSMQDTGDKKMTSMQKRKKQGNRNTKF